MKLSQLISDLEDLYNAYGDMTLIKEAEDEINRFFNVSIAYRISGLSEGWKEKGLRLDIQEEEEI